MAAKFMRTAVKIAVENKPTYINYVVFIKNKQIHLNTEQFPLEIVI